MVQFGFLTPVYLCIETDSCCLLQRMDVDWNLKRLALSLKAMSAKSIRKIIMVTAPWQNLSNVVFIILQKLVVYGLRGPGCFLLMPKLHCWFAFVLWSVGNVQCLIFLDHCNCYGVVILSLMVLIRNNYELPAGALDDSRAKWLAIESDDLKNL